MNKVALQLTSRFSSAPNKLGYCGLDSAQKAFYECIVHGQCEAVPGEIPHFKGLYPYLKTIAEVLNKDLLDYEVVEAYWLGNDMLKKFKPEHYQLLIKNLEEQQLPDFFIEQVKNKQPKAFIPLHLFNVVHIGVGQITGSVPYTLESVNHCMIRKGTVLNFDLKAGQVTVDLTGLQAENDWYSFSSIQETVAYDPDFLPDLQTGAEVAVHWKRAVKQLTETESHNLTYWTQKVLESLSPAS